MREVCTISKYLLSRFSKVMCRNSRFSRYNALHHLSHINKELGSLSWDNSLSVRNAVIIRPDPTTKETIQSICISTPSRHYRDAEGGGSSHGSRSFQGLPQH